ncbi:MAG TPA: 2,3-bisphosphoglycerate-independent phosphoglycerate mutase [Clostridiales bacterium]|nr:2,3-bisphosphoglycerate-independent phosphoglycerate mutase [Clostridiales bacterium]
MLKKIDGYKPYKGPILMIVMDGIGLGQPNDCNAVHLANTPNLDYLMKNYPTLALKAHGTAVGLPGDDDMGNSEVGHNAIGAGKVYSQGAKLVGEAVETGDMFLDTGWRDISQNCLDHNSTLHFIGLFSDGNVHSHIYHLKGMIIQAKKQGIKEIRIHILLDGRDVGERSALDYVLPFEQFLNEINDDCCHCVVASGGGRMNITMDRYGANWAMVEKGWKTHVLGEGRPFESAEQAIETYRKELNVIDQDMPPFVIVKDGEPVGTIQDNDSVVFFNFRGDRAIEISRAFEEADFDVFDRVRYPKVTYAGMLQYDGDLGIPSRFLVSPPKISNTMGEFLAKEGVAQLAISETQKYGHVTYFWNGNRSGKYSETNETYIEIPSDVVPFEQRPWMQSALIADRLMEELKSGQYQFARVNFPNGDMVGHTGNMQATIIGVEAVDLALGRILKVVDQLGGMAIITADHGNADEMFETDKAGNPKKNKDGSYKAKTSHTLNKVPCILYDNHNNGRYSVVPGEYGLSNLASTIVNLLGYEKYEDWDAGIIQLNV